jgi:hypothetical protein
VGARWWGAKLHLHQLVVDAEICLSGVRFVTRPRSRLGARSALQIFIVEQKASGSSKAGCQASPSPVSCRRRDLLKRKSGINSTLDIFSCVKRG